MESPPVDDSRSYPFNFTISGSRRRVLQGLRAWVDLGLLTPEQLRSIVEVYQLEPQAEENEPAATPTSGIPSETSVPAGIGPAYVLWGLALFGICGIHRFYLGRWRTGLLWLCTFGLLGIGQLLDLIWIPKMVREKNALLVGAAVRATEEPQAAAQPETTTTVSGPEALPRSPQWLATLLQNLLAELSVRWLLFLGLFLVVVSSGVLAAGQWEQFPPTAQYGVLLAYTAAFGAGAWWAQRQEGLRLTGQTLEAIALLLLPVNVWALDGLGIPWGIRIVALGLLVGIPVLAYRYAMLPRRGRVRATESSAGYAFYGTLMNFLALSGLQAFWGIGPQELRPAVALVILYLGILSTVAYTWSRRSLELRGSKLWLVGAAGSLLVLRGLLSGQVQVSQLGLAVALLGCLSAEWPQGSSDAPGSSEDLAQDWMPSRGWSQAGWVLLVLGWLLAASGLAELGFISRAESPFTGWQLLGISLLGIRFLARRLSQRKQRVDLAWLFLLGLETIWASWQALPESWQWGALSFLVNRFGIVFFPWALLGLALLPYEVLWLGLAARWQRSSQESSEEGTEAPAVAARSAGKTDFSSLVRPTEGLVLGLGGSLLLLSLPHPAIRFWHLLLSTGILSWWLRQKSRTAEATDPRWLFLTHAYGVGALLAGIRWLLPHLFAPAVRSTSLSAWGAILLLLGLLEWAGRVVLGGRLSAGHFGGLPVRLWQQSTEGIGLVLVGSSYFAFLLQRFLNLFATGEPSIGWLWLLVPLVLTAAQVLALPPLEFMPRWLQIPEQGGVGSWRQGIPVRGSLRPWAVLSLVMAQLLTLDRLGVDLLGLGLGLLLLATQVWLWASPSPSSPAPEALLAVAFGLGVGLVGIGRLFPTLTEAEWLLALAVLLLLLSGCRYGLQNLSPRLQPAYRPALDGWGTLLGLVLLLSLTLSTAAALFTPSSPPAFSAAIPLASGVTLLAIGLRLWVEVAPVFSAPIGETGSPSTLPASASGTESSPIGDPPESSQALSSGQINGQVDGLLYGLAWVLELLVASGVLWAVQGSRPALPILSAINLGLGIFFWIGPERTVFLKEWGQPWHQLTSWWAGPLIYAGLGWLGSHTQWSELTGVGSLGLSIVLLGLGRRQAIHSRQRAGDPFPQRQFHLGILGVFGVSLAAYESWIYFLSQQSGGSLGDGLVLIGLLGLILALGYRLCPPWIAAALQLKTTWLGWIGIGNWGLASFVLLPALLDLSGLGENLWLITGSGLAAYAAWQGRRPSLLPASGSSPQAEEDSIPSMKLANPTAENASSTASTANPTPEPAWVPFLWCYFSALQWAGILAVALLLWLPGVDLWVWGGSLACWLGLVYYFLPWQRWGWPAGPWQNTATVLPIAVMLLTASETNSSNLLLGAAYYTFLSIQRSQVRLGYVSLFLSNWILLDFGWQQEWSSLTLYALPLVGSLLYVAQVDPGLQQASARERRHWLRAFSSGLLVLVTLIETHEQLWAGFWPVGLGLALGLLGLALQVRAYLFMGTLSFGLGVLRQGWLLVTTYSLLLWGIGILLGILLIWIAANFEQRREQMGSWLDTWLGQLQSWE